MLAVCKRHETPHLHGSQSFPAVHAGSCVVKSCDFSSLMQWQVKNWFFVDMKTPGRTRTELIHYTSFYVSFSAIGSCSPVSASKVFPGIDNFTLAIDLF